MEGAFSGKLIRAQDAPKREVQPGSVSTSKIEDPLDKVAKATMGKFPYEANGAVEWRPENLQLLGS